MILLSWDFPWSHLFATKVRPVKVGMDWNSVLSGALLLRQRGCSE